MNSAMFDGEIPVATVLDFSISSGRAATPVRSGVHQMDTGFGRQVSTCLGRNGGTRNDLPHVKF
jgi:hypothetical protein